MPILTPNSDNIVEANKLTDQLSGNLISGATVQMESLKDDNLVDVTGIVFPIAMPEISAGLYRGNIPDTAVLGSTKTAVGTISSDNGVDQHREWCIQYIIDCS